MIFGRDSILIKGTYTTNWDVLCLSKSRASFSFRKIAWMNKTMMAQVETIEINTIFFF